MFRTAMKAGVALVALAALTSTGYARETHDTGHGQHARNTERTLHGPGVKPHGTGVKPALVIVDDHGKKLYNDHADDGSVCVYSKKAGLSCNFVPQGNQGDTGDDQDN